MARAKKIEILEGGPARYRRVNGLPRGKKTVSDTSVHTGKIPLRTLAALAAAGMIALPGVLPAQTPNQPVTQGQSYMSVPAQMANGAPITATAPVYNSVKPQETDIYDVVKDYMGTYTKVDTASIRNMVLLDNIDNSPYLDNHDPTVRDGIRKYIQAKGKNRQFAVIDDYLLKLNKRGTKVLKHIPFEKLSNPESLDKILNGADIEGFLDYPNDDDVSDFSATAVDSASGQNYPMEVENNRFYIEELDTPVVNPNTPTIPKSFELSPPYPNPNTGEFNIQVGLPKDGNIILGIYDELGRKVDMKDYGRRMAGHHEISANGIDLYSGRYFINALVDGMKQTQKAVILRGNRSSNLVGNSLEGRMLGAIKHIDSEIPVLNEQNYGAKKTAGDGKVYFIQLRSNKNPVEFEDQDIRVQLLNDTTLYAAAREPINFQNSLFTTKEDSGLVVPIDSLVQGNYGLQSVDVSSGSGVMYTDKQGNNIVISTDQDVNSTDYGLLPLNIVAIAPHGTQASGSADIDIGEMTDLSGIIKHVYGELAKPGWIEVDGQRIYTDGNGNFDSQFEPKDNLTVRARSMDGSSPTSFILTMHVPGLQDTLGMPMKVVGYDSLNTNPELFKAFAEEGNMRGGWPYDNPAGLKGIDYENARDYTLWIAKNSLVPGKSFTTQEQQFIKNWIETKIFPDVFPDTDNRPSIYLATEQDTVPAGGDGYMVDGTILIQKNYQPTVATNDKNKDGIFETATIGLNYADEAHGLDITGETASALFCPYAIYNPDLGNTTIFFQGMRPSVFTLNDKTLNAIVRNMTSYYGALKSKDELLGLQ